MQKNGCIGPIDTRLVPSNRERSNFNSNDFEVELESSEHINTGIPGYIFAPRGKQLTEDNTSQTNYCEAVPPRRYVEGDSHNVYISHARSNAHVAVLGGTPGVDINGINCQADMAAHALCSSDLVFVSLSLFDEESAGSFSKYLIKLLDSKKTETVLVPVHWDAFFIPLSDLKEKVERSERLKMVNTISMKRAHKRFSQKISNSQRVSEIWMTAFDKLYVGK